MALCYHLGNLIFLEHSLFCQGSFSSSLHILVWASHVSHVLQVACLVELQCFPSFLLVSFKNIYIKESQAVLPLWPIDFRQSSKGSSVEKGESSQKMGLKQQCLHVQKMNLESCITSYILVQKMNLDPCIASYIVTYNVSQT